MFSSFHFACDCHSSSATAQEKIWEAEALLNTYKGAGQRGKVWYLYTQENEIKNGRLAMVAFLGFVAQHAATGKVGPLASCDLPLLGNSRWALECGQ